MFSLASAKRQLRHTLLESGPACVQLLFALRFIVLALFVSGEVYFKCPDLAFLNVYMSAYVLGLLGFAGLCGLFFEAFIVSYLFVVLGVIFFGLLGYACIFNHYHVLGANFLFEMLALIWLAFRLQYDRAKRQIKRSS